MILSRNKVFTPNSFPAHTYVERKEARHEQDLRDAFENEGQIVSVTGPSKSGKTVLVERVVGADNLIPITGAGLESAEELWQRILRWMGEPSAISTAEAKGAQIGGSVNGTGTVEVPLVAKAQLQAGVTAGANVIRTTTSHYEKHGLTQVVKEIAGSDFVVLIDDFHYIRRDLQGEIIKQIKEAARQHVKFVLASVPHRGDDPIMANPDVRGRLFRLKLDYWSTDDLRQIADVGFNLLNVILSSDSIDRFVQESARSPQLMQSICLSTCQQSRVLSTSERPQSINLDEIDIRGIFESTSRSGSFHEFVSALDSGPKVRGTPRLKFRLNDGLEGDVYRCVLRAIAADPPKLSFNYEDIIGRIRRVCASDPPVGSAVTGSLNQMHGIATENFPNENAIDWNSESGALNIPDPYFLFYLRWSGHLEQTE